MFSHRVSPACRCSTVSALHKVGKPQHLKPPNLDRRGKAVKCSAAAYKNEDVRIDMKQAVLISGAGLAGGLPALLLSTSVDSTAAVSRRFKDSSILQTLACRCLIFKRVNERSAAAQIPEFVSSTSVPPVLQVCVWQPR